MPINDDVLKMSILSAVEDKVHRFNSDIYSQNCAEVEVLQNTNRDLKKGTEIIRKMLDDMSHDTVRMLSLGIVSNVGGWIV